MIVSYNMHFNDPIFWSFIVTLCSIALLTEASLLFHVLFVTRQRFWRYLLVIFPVAVSLWSFAVALDTSNKFESLPLVGYVYYGFASYHALKEIIAHLISACQLQAVRTIAVFAAMLILRRIMLPRTDRPPVWTLAKDRFLSMNL